MLESQGSRQRQARLLQRMQALKLDAAVVGFSPHVYYFSAFRPFWLHEAAMLIRSDGRSTLIASRQIEQSAADEVISFEASWHGTQRQEQPATIAEAAASQLQSWQSKRIGVDASAVTSQLLLRLAASASHVDTEAIDSQLWQMRRAKDPDELVLMRKAFACADAMYARAREIIEPGIEETRVFSELHAAAVAEAGEPLSAVLGNDYACGTGGGPPRANRRAQAGEIYILDVGPAYRGYFADASRCFAVGSKPSDTQQRAHATLAAVFPMIEKAARPGVRCRDLYSMIDDHLKRASASGTGLTHHLGHGVGLQPHEYPHLNPRWDDTLIEGEIFTVEPGIYGENIRGGLRLENAYRVTEQGLENLVSARLDL